MEQNIQMPVNIAKDAVSCYLESNLQDNQKQLENLLSFYPLQILNKI